MRISAININQYANFKAKRKKDDDKQLYKTPNSNLQKIKAITDRTIGVIPESFPLQIQLETEEYLEIDKITQDFCKNREKYKAEADSLINDFVTCEKIYKQNYALSQVCAKEFDCDTTTCFIDKNAQLILTQDTKEPWKLIINGKYDDNDNLIYADEYYDFQRGYCAQEITFDDENDYFSAQKLFIIRPGSYFAKKFNIAEHPSVFENVEYENNRFSADKECEIVFNSKNEVIRSHYLENTKGIKLKAKNKNDSIYQQSAQKYFQQYYATGYAQPAIYGRKMYSFDYKNGDYKIEYDTRIHFYQNTSIGDIETDYERKNNKKPFCTNRINKVDFEKY